MSNGNEALREYRRRLLEQIAACIELWDVVSSEPQSLVDGKEMQEALYAIAHMLSSHGIELPYSVAGEELKTNAETSFDYSWLPRTLQGLPDEAWNWTWRHAHFGIRTLQWWVERCLTLANAWHLPSTDKGFMQTEN